jgi:GTPase-activating protein SST2
MALTNTSHPNHHLPTLSSDSDFSPQTTYVDDGNTSTPRPSIADLPTATVSPTDSDRQATFKNRQSTQSTTSSNKANRTGLFTLAALARDKTSSAIASFTDPTIRTRSSSGNLARQSASSSSIAIPSSPKTGRTSTTQDDDIPKHQETPEVPRASTSTLSPTQNSRSQPSRGSSPSGQRQSLLDTDPPSQSYDTTDTNTPSPINFVPQSNYNKMHQTSSRLLRMTDDERPFTRVGCTR